MSAALAHKVIATLKIRLLIFLGCLGSLATVRACPVQAQGGPPFLTNDPGTPGNGNWEINIASAQSVVRGQADYQSPQLDINLGIGNRIQLTYQGAYVLQTRPGQPTQTGWTNALPGVKWRFFDQGPGGWQISIFPQIQTGASLAARLSGIAGDGPRFYLPLEIARQVGPLDLNFEIGYFFPWSGPEERTIGFVAGHSFTKRLELDGEVYNDWAMHALPHSTTWDFGGRYKLHDGFVLLFMAGRSFSSNASGQPEYLGYFGIQVLLSKFGRTLTHDE